MNRIILITGEKNSGKTSFLKHFIDQVAIKKNLPYGGFITEGIFKSGQKTGLDLIELSHYQRKLLCKNIPRKGWIRMGQFFFDPEGFSFGEQVLSNLPESTDWIIIDEYGPLELSGTGWRNVIDQLMEKEGLTLMMTARLDILPDVIENLKGHEIHVFNISQNQYSRIIEALKKLMPL